MRRSIRIGVVVALFGIMVVPAASMAEPGVERLENDAVAVDVDRDHGTFLRLVDKVGGMELAPAREMAENFRLLIPTSADPGNLVLGRKQKLNGIALDGDTLSLEWKRPLVDEKGNSHNIDVSMRLSLRPAGIEVNCSLQNDSGGTVEEVWYPMLGGVLGLDGKDEGAKVSLMPPPHDSKSFARPFGEYAVGYPGNNMSFVDLEATAHGWPSMATASTPPAAVHSATENGAAQPITARPFTSISSNGKATHSNSRRSRVWSSRLPRSPAAM